MSLGNDNKPASGSPSATNDDLSNAANTSSSSWWSKLSRIGSWLFYCCGFFGPGQYGDYSCFSIIIYGQVLSFFMAAAGAAQGTLQLDCHLSAPSLSVTPFYFCLALAIVPLYCVQQRPNYGKQNCRQSKKSDDDDETSTNFDMMSSSMVFEEEQSPITKFLGEEGNAKTPGLLGSRNVAAPRGVFKYSFFGFLPLIQPNYVYILTALADFYGNYFTVLAFRYTTITSVALTDAFAIPSAMALSYCWLERKYSTLHYLGIAACMFGISLDVIQDCVYDEKMKAAADHDRLLHNAEDPYPHKALGDTLGLVGGVLFGVSNTVAEYLVRDPTATPLIANLEYLSMLGIWSSIICIFQVALLEPDRIKHFIFFMESDRAEQMCSAEKAFALWMGFSICLLLLYIGNARFLQISEAVFLNLSLLTGDFWSVGFSVVAENIKPLPMFYPSLAFIVGGTVLYEMIETPEGHDHHHYDAEGKGGTKDIDGDESDGEYVTGPRQGMELSGEQPLTGVASDAPSRWV